METATTPMQSKPLVDVTCKLGTKGCFKDGRCHYIGNCENKIETNADRIRAMSDEELATDLLDLFEEICEDGVPSKEWMLKWLKQPAEGE